MAETFFAAATHVGLKRERNEDSYIVRPEAGLWAVADGMGGHGGGDVASRIVTDALAALPIETDGEARIASFEAAIAEANRRIRAHAAEEGRAVMGTTLVALLIIGAHVGCLWCGDSRAYRLREGTLRQMTRDHSELQDLVDRGVLRPEEAKHWPRRSVLTRALGATEAVELDVVSDRLAPGDTFLICSDGLTGHCSDADIVGAMSGGDLQQICDGLVDLTLQRGAKDNVTVIALRWQG